MMVLYLTNWRLMQTHKVLLKYGTTKILMKFNVIPSGSVLDVDIVTHRTVIQEIALKPRIFFYT